MFPVFFLIITENRGFCKSVAAMHIMLVKRKGDKKGQNIYIVKSIGGFI